MYMYLPAEVQPAVYMYDVPYLSTLHVPYLTLRYTLSLAGPASLASFRAIPTFWQIPPPPASCVCSSTLLTFYQLHRTLLSCTVGYLTALCNYLHPPKLKDGRKRSTFRNSPRLILDTSP